MNSIGFRLILLLIIAVLAQGCAEDQVEKKQPKPSSDVAQVEKQQTARPTNQDILLDLKSRLEVSSEDLDRQKSENRDLQNRIQSLTQTLRDEESETEKLRAELSKPAPKKNVKDFPGRVSLMGAKALAEFKAKQMSQRVEKLRQDLESKEQELASIRQNALQKEQAVATLTKRIQDLQNSQNAKVEQLTSRLDQISKDLAARSAETEQLRKGMEDKTTTLHALKTAIADSGRLKQGAENETARLKTALTEMEKHLVGAKAEAEQGRLQIAQLQKDAEQNRVYAEQQRTDSDQLRTHATQIHAELTKAQQEAKSLKDQLAQITGPTTTQDPAPSPVPTSGPSNVEMILQMPIYAESPPMDVERH